MSSIEYNETNIKATLTIDLFINMRYLYIPIIKVETWKNEKYSLPQIIWCFEHFTSIKKYN